MYIYIYACVVFFCYNEMPTKPKLETLVWYWVTRPIFILEAHLKGLSIHKLGATGATASASAQDAMAKLSSGPMVLPDLPGGAEKRSPTGLWIGLWMVFCYGSCYVMLCHVTCCENMWKRPFWNKKLNSLNKRRKRKFQNIQNHLRW